MLGTMKQIIAGFAGKRVLVVGDLMLDEYIWGDVRRISPEAPVPVVTVRRRTHVPGGASNTAINVATLGGRALLAGVVGADLPGTRLCEVLQQRGVATEAVILDRGRITTTKTRVLAHQQQVVRVDDEEIGPLAAELQEQLLRLIDERMPEVDACILSDYAKGTVSPSLAQGLIVRARQAGKPVVVDPKGSDFAKYRGATVIKPNIHEARQVCPQLGNGEPGPAELSRHLLALLEGSALLLTCGADGMSLFEPGAGPVHIPSMARDVFDVTGAGDTVAGTLALALAAGASLELAAHLANRAAGIVVAKVGTAQANADELLASCDVPYP
jgi:rfaE bifunctional protein kinase chain/domain